MLLSWMQHRFAISKAGGDLSSTVCQLLGSISRDSGPGRWLGRKGTVPTAKPENLNWSMELTSWDERSGPWELPSDLYMCCRMRASPPRYIRTNRRWGDPRQPLVQSHRRLFEHWMKGHDPTVENHTVLVRRHSIPIETCVGYFRSDQC